MFVIYGISAQKKHIADLVVDPGKYLRIDCPVSVSLEGFNINIYEGLILEEILDNKIIIVDCQLEAGVIPKLWWILGGNTFPGTTRQFKLFAKSSENKQDINTQLNKNTIQVNKKRKKVLQYNYMPLAPPTGVDSLFTRGAFIHPLWSPSGEILTRIQPPDHYHHLGIWNPWTKTKFEGREVDFWNLGKGQGTVRFKSFKSILNGNVFGGFKAIHEHVDLSAPEGEKLAMNEEWEIRIWDTGGENKDYYLLDIISTLNCATDSPLVIEKYRYAGLGFRATELWHSDNSGTITSEGLTGRSGDSSRARWCNVFGEMKEGKAGIVFMSHPYNREHPEPMRIWPEDSNGGKENMFFEFCPIKEKNWIIEPGEEFVLRYRLYVYNGVTSNETSERLWRDFAFPPQTHIMKY